VTPETRYAKSGDVHIAYQVMGEGPDLVFVPAGVTHLELRWEYPEYAKFLRRLSSFSRVISLDKRGCGLSDRTGAAPTMEEQAQDILAVMDDAGSPRATIFGSLDGGVSAIFFAATYPNRTAGLVTWGTPARAVLTDDYPWGLPPETFDALVSAGEADPGSAGIVAVVAPSKLNDPLFTHWFARYRRSSSSPAAAAAYFAGLRDIDIRATLPLIRSPTLVLQRTGDRLVHAGQGRYLAQHIPGARYVELPGDDYLFYATDTDPIADEIEEFLTGVRHGPEGDRVLATVVFTDIVESTRVAAELGDRGWHQLLDRHDALIVRELQRHRGHKVHSIGVGDGILATFDGPARAIRCACAIRDEARSLGLEVRAGLHAGEIERRGADVGGIAVHIGARVASLAGPGEVLVSGTVRDLVAGSGIAFADRGVHALKGVPDEWRVFAVLD
jgi:class 3 adenylate cyclase